MTSYETARTPEEVEAWRPWWLSLHHANLDTHPDVFLTIVRHDPAVVGPCVLRVHCPGEEPVLVVARLTEERFRLRLAGARFGSVRAPTLVVSFDGVVGADSPAQRAAVTAAIDDVLRSGPADVVVFQKLDRAGPLLGELGQRSPRRYWARGHEAWWRLSLPGSWDELLASRSAKSRRQLRFDDGKLRRTYGDRLALRRLDLPEHADRLYAELADVASASYQRSLGVSLMDTPVQRALMELAHDRGWLRVWMLYVDEKPVAFWWGVAQGGVLIVESPGYLPQFARDGVGSYTFRRMLEDAANDPGIELVDFGTGEAHYKARFGDIRSDVADVFLFASRVRPLLVHALVRSLEYLLSLARAGVASSGRADAVRRWWRTRRSAPGHAESAPTDRTVESVEVTHAG